jgi:Ca2+-binding EF-hand superfamily protein
LKEFTNRKAENLTKEEKRFYEFKLHDLNNDSLLDGLELLWLIGSSTIHAHNKPFDELVELTDYAIQNYDTDLNGYITYAEIHG